MDLSSIFADAPEYVILRMSPEFPKWRKGQDVDILVRDFNEWIEHLQQFIEVNYYEYEPQHYQADYYENGEFVFKFDFYERYISKEFTDTVFTTFQSVFYKDYCFCIPNRLHDHISKCYECVTLKKKQHEFFKRYKKDLDRFMI
jgi:hypothetical protein